MKQFTISAPGKIILHGEHSVVYNKLAIASSLDLRTIVKFNLLDEGDSIIINLPNVNINTSFNINKITEEILNKVPFMDYKHPEEVPHFKLYEIINNFISSNKYHTNLLPVFYLMVGILNNYELKPFQIAINTKLNIGAGMGSSASFCVVLAASFLQYRYLKQQQFNNDDLNIINQWAYQAEKITHGTPSGIDNTICTYGGWVEYKKNQPPNIYKVTKNIRILLINTKLSRVTKKQVEKVQILRETFPKIIENILSAMDETSIMAAKLLENIQNGREIEENYKKLIDLSKINQNLLNSINVGHEKLDLACALLAKYDLGGKLTGAGGGGCAFTYIPPNFNEDTLNVIIKELEDKDFEAIVTLMGSPGVRLE